MACGATLASLGLSNVTPQQIACNPEVWYTCGCGMSYGKEFTPVSNGVNPNTGIPCASQIVGYTDRCGNTYNLQGQLIYAPDVNGYHYSVNPTMGIATQTGAVWGGDSGGISLGSLLTTVADVAAVATGNPELVPIINGVSTVAQGGSICQALTNAAVSYVGANYVAPTISCEIAIANCSATTPTTAAAGKAVANTLGAVVTGGNPISAALSGAAATGLNAACVNPAVAAATANLGTQAALTGSITPASLISAGATVVANSNGSQTATFPDGSTLTTNADGQVVDASDNPVTMSNSVTNQDGTITETYSDGSTITYGADGQVVNATDANPNLPTVAVTGTKCTPVTCIPTVNVTGAKCGSTCLPTVVVTGTKCTPVTCIPTVEVMGTKCTPSCSATSGSAASVSVSGGSSSGGSGSSGAKASTATTPVSYTPVVSTTQTTTQGVVKGGTDNFNIANSFGITPFINPSSSCNSSNTMTASTITNPLLSSSETVPGGSISDLVNILKGSV